MSTLYEWEHGIIDQATENLVKNIKEHTYKDQYKEVLQLFIEKFKLEIEKEELK